ncbi:MAG: carbamate kinase [Gemmatimonadetes bacterium]|nr:carbamate kinase [Gemmatimonadota bacterium]
MDPLIVVIALGGNALLQRGEPVSAEVQRKNMRTAGAAIADVAREHHVVLTHGNGPQVGLLALQEASYSDIFQNPLDVLGAETEGMIGYLIEQELSNRLPGREILTLLTRVQVDPSDPAFQNPTKPIGPLFEPDEARRIAAKLGWSLAPDGDKLRRVVPSPLPKEIIPAKIFRRLLVRGVLVICAGGGGIPVTWDEENGWQGVEAVIDKDRTASLLAQEGGAHGLVMLTDVPKVEVGFGTPDARPIDRATPSELRALADEFPVGSMGPKITAALEFVEATGGFAAIGSLADAPAIVRQEGGTIVVPD